jgi:putative transposase
MALLDLGTAYKRFFSVQKQGEKFSQKTIERAKRNGKKLTNYDLIGHPKFKAKGKAKDTFCMQCDAFYFTDKGAKIPLVGDVSYQTDYEVPQGKCKFSNPRVCFIGGKWILTFGMEIEAADYKLNDYAMGIDLGVDKTAVVSCNGAKTVYKNINKSQRMKKLKKQLKRAQRKSSRTQSKSKGQAKSYARQATIQNRIANIRHDFRHKMTRELVDKLPHTIVLEDLNVRGMMKNRHLSKAIGEQGFYAISQMLSYKANERGIKIQYADRFYPSSKRCSSCGEIKADLKLSDRKYTCGKCGVSIDRDYNAAMNLERLA